MNKTKRKPSAFFELGFMSLLSVICAIFIATSHLGLKSRAESDINALRATFDILSLACPPGKETELFNSLFIKRHTGKNSLWQSKNDKKLWLCQAKGAGMWAEIVLVFIYNIGDGQIKGLRVIYQAETASLGDRITEEDFYSQFNGINANNGIEAAKIRIKNNQFDAISGATVSSRAIEAITNRALKEIDVQNMALGEGKA